MDRMARIEQGLRDFGSAMLIVFGVTFAAYGFGFCAFYAFSN